MAKSMPRLDQGCRGMGKGTSLPSGRQHGVDVMAQPKQPLTKQSIILTHVGPPVSVPE